MKKELDVVNGGQSPEKTAKAYRIRIVQSPDIDWDSVAAADICEYVWGGTYRPAAQARLVFVSGDGFYARLNCREASPRTVYRNFLIRSTAIAVWSFLPVGTVSHPIM